MKLTETLFDTSSSSESHYELIAIEQAIAGIGASVEIDIAPLTAEVAAIKDLLVEQRETTEALKAEAQEILEAHREAAQNYIGQAESNPTPDWYPFVELPEGTAIRELPDGNKLFTLTDGVILRTTGKHTLMVVDNAGNHEAIPGPGTLVEVQPGRTYELVEEWLETTHEEAGIAGLPPGTEVIQIAPERYAVMLSAGARMVVDRKTRIVTVSNPGGTTDIIGISRIEGIGEEIDISIQDDGERGFSCTESGHAGMVGTDGTIELSLSGGEDLVITFPSSGTGAGTGGTGTGTGACDGLICEVRS